jgi:hypothetical protein
VLERAPGLLPVSRPSVGEKRSDQVEIWVALQAAIGPLALTRGDAVMSGRSSNQCQGAIWKTRRRSRPRWNAALQASGRLRKAVHVWRGDARASRSGSPP